MQKITIQKKKLVQRSFLQSNNCTGNRKNQPDHPSLCLNSRRCGLVVLGGCRLLGQYNQFLACIASNKHPSDAIEGNSNRPKAIPRTFAEVLRPDQIFCSLCADLPSFWAARLKRNMYDGISDWIFPVKAPMICHESVVKVVASQTTAILIAFTGSTGYFWTIELDVERSNVGLQRKCGFLEAVLTVGIREGGIRICSELVRDRKTCIGNIGIPSGEAGRVAVVGALKGGSEGAVIVEFLARVIIVDVFPFTGNLGNSLANVKRISEMVTHIIRRIFNAPDTPVRMLSNTDCIS